MSDDWTGSERRGIDGITLKLMTEVRAMLEKHEKMEEIKFRELKDDIDGHRNESAKRHDELVRRFEEMSQSTMNVFNQINTSAKETRDLFKRSIPNEDPEGHKNAHLAQIEEAKERKDFYKFVKYTVVAAVSVGLLGWITNPIWQAFLQGPKG
jgi:hypothetical protein